MSYTIALSDGHYFPTMIMGYLFWVALMYNHLDAVKSKYSLEQKMFFNSALKIVPKNVQFPLVFE